MLNIELSPTDLNTRFPWLRTDDLLGAHFGPRGERWCDPFQLLQAYRRKAISLGVVYLQDRLERVVRRGHRVDGADLGSRERLMAGHIVCAAGARGAGRLAVDIDLNLPVEPRKRYIYAIEVPGNFPDCPVTLDALGVFLKPDTACFLAGLVPESDESDPWCEDYCVDYDRFEERI